MTSEELENRLIDFAVECIKITKETDNSFASQHLCSQLIRSATSVPLNYSEARAAQSYRDYIHKMQVSLKSCSLTNSTPGFQDSRLVTSDLTVSQISNI
jgi:four helix bundle protein